MATILEYADIARAVYQKPVSFYPQGHLLQGWTIKNEHWEDGSLLFGNGFQGGIYQNDTEVILGFAGTKNFGSDLSADMRIGLNILPNQASSAYKMAKRAIEILGSRKLSATGHSLGGGLAQIIGVWCNIPFVTFNAPPMKNALRAAKGNIAKPQMMARTLNSDIGKAQGVNFRVEGDSVSWLGLDHVGKVITLPKTNGGFMSHFMDICYDLIKQHDTYPNKTLMEMCA